MNTRLLFTLPLLVVIILLPMETANAQASSMNGSMPVTTIVSVDTTFINDFDCPFLLLESREAKALPLKQGSTRS